MMKVCLINTNQAWGGGEKWYLETSLSLKSHNIEVEVVTNLSSELKDRLTEQNIRTTTFIIKKLSFINPFMIAKIKKFFKANTFDAVIMNLPIDVKCFAKHAYKSGVRKVIYRRGMNHPIKDNFLNRYLYENFITDIIANSEDVKKSISLHIPSLQLKTSILYNGIDTHHLNKVLPTPKQNKLRLGNLGRLVEQKGQLDLIELAKILKNKNLPFEILIAGTGPFKDQLENVIQHNNLQSEIKLMGMMNPKDFFDLIDYFIFPSRFEGLSNALLEALEFKKPIFCFDCASNSEIVQHNLNGILIEPFNIAQMAQEIEDLSKDQTRYQQFQENGLQILEDKFDQNKIFHSFIELLKK